MSWKNELPDELWRKILEIGIKASNFTFKDLCCVSICSRRLHRLSNEDLLWFEREKERKLWAHKRAVLRKESQVSEHLRKLREIEVRLREERNKLNSALLELSNLHKVSQASVALNVWQPEVVRGRQKQMVEQCVVPVESRVHALDMEVKLCNQQLQVFDKAYRDEKRRLDTAKEELKSMKYHPLRDYTLSSTENQENRKKRKKLKNMHQL
ncbi:hypothetical protein ES332_D13G124300v1 [Gossypium tomentosum]|uniref:F-box domain-containing protein n=1 Tax=Gossypium tomentosum TaxID=34277 RepID=A0A5D2HWJ2_GOSTO|nr:hypothetical protein ES332_D13G124300v1 [Gossypium tomentosum]